MDRLLDIFRALGDPTRLRIFALLRRMELSVGELAQVLGQSQPRVSRHVRILADAGLTTRRREGSWVFLALAEDPRNEPLLAAIEHAAGDWVDEDAARLAAVRTERAEAAERYFAERAGEWDAIRSLYVPEQQVEAAMAEMLGERPVGRLVDLGTGTGRMIELFGASSTRALGVDRSPEMLRLARAKLAEAVPAAELRQGDLTALPLADGLADTVILHQVLHFVPQPGTALGEAARLVADGGRMLIVDFAPHEREELRTRDAHQRLGFSDGQIEGWLNAAGLELSAIRELEGGELTVKLWLAERPSAVREKAA
ncbi:metalloregulator ArsR/SmtB family transcription factor [Sphingomonas sp. MAH-20]|uniref:Metalloregulator ArsR/SmtB family transcription factor n=1 Tax=Sphingomonas horti TaxID=2682842 RepID=A0A6I4IYM4_9SPHN|nr:metalloregulator ArsR/SmtB family transcription factor [Sphingomonas sp. CGMCC 1.13658]MBA2918236.1 metalloregulator ArsR/SmtB family transcription factor [Sphingomonas sp. CGMCC 1.13658]MVO77204.1 metalloregulator ArsR/SmtB family transcription factor [Sphingomonas horti]